MDFSRAENCSAKPVMSALCALPPCPGNGNPRNKESIKVRDNDIPGDSDLFIVATGDERMPINSLEISVRGKWVTVPALDIGRTAIVVTGKWIKIAVIHDDEWLEGEL